MQNIWKCGNMITVEAAGACKTQRCQLEIKGQGSMVKRLRHRPFTAVTGVQIPLESFALKANADVAQLAEQLICNQQVIGSSPIIGFLDP